jgi:hypothetical protein
MSSLTPGILVRSGSHQQNPVVYGLQMQKDMHLTNLTIPFDQGLVLPKNVPLVLVCQTTLSPIVLTASTAPLSVGISVSGTGIPIGATIISVDANGVNFTLSAPATVAFPVTGVVLTFGINGYNPSFISAKNGNAIIPVNSAATFEVNDLTVKGNFLPAQNTSIAGAAFVPGAGTSVHSDSTFDGYTLGQIVAILKVHGIVQ